jgi:hypothetical protein
VLIAPEFVKAVNLVAVEPRPRHKRLAHRLTDLRLSGPLRREDPRSPSGFVHARASAGQRLTAAAP